MPVYLFQLQNAETENYEIELIDDLAAMAEAQKTAADLIKEFPVPERGEHSYKVSVRLAGQSEAIFVIEIRTARIR